MAIGGEGYGVALNFWQLTHESAIILMFMENDLRTNQDQSRSAAGGRQPHTRIMSARQAAFQILMEGRAGRKTAREVIDKYVRRGGIPGTEMGLTMELVMGVVRHRLTLAKVLGRISSKGWQQVNPKLQQILMLGAFQIIWLDGIPEFAAVNEAVELAKTKCSRNAGHFVNALLRQLLREIQQKRIISAQADPTKTLPIDNQHGCQFRQAMFPDPAIQPVEYLSVTTSHPQWLVSHWIKQFGVDKAVEICQAGICRPPMFIRPNLLRTNSEKLIDHLKNEGFEVRSVPDADSAIISQGARWTDTDSFRKGLFQPQDRTAAKAVEAMALSPGMIVLDLCAGVGTKSTQIAEIMQNRGIVLASDKDEQKLKLVKENCQRLGINIVQTVIPRRMKETLQKLPSLDWIIIDVPCSNSGVLARRPEARYRINNRVLAKLKEIQLQLLDRASRLAGDKTRLLYSTCSIERDENEEVLTAFVQSHSQWQILNSQRTFPSAGLTPEEWQDGGFWAVMVRE